MVYRILINDIPHRYCVHCQLFHPLTRAFWRMKRGKLQVCKIRSNKYQRSPEGKLSRKKSSQRNWPSIMVAHSRSEDKKKNRYNPVGYIDRNFLEMQLILQNSKCFYCGSQMEYGVGFSRKRQRGLTVERLDNSKGHLKTNCVLCCFGCQHINHPSRKKQKVS